MTVPDLPDYVRTYRDFWRDIVEHPDGTLNRDQIMRELHDYHHLMEQAAIAYSEVTGRISKPNTMAHHVIGEAEERTQEAIKDAVRAERAAIADEIEAAVPVCTVMSSSQVVHRAQGMNEAARIARGDQ